MAEFVQALLASPDSDEVVDAAKQVLRNARYTGRQHIHPAFRDWFVDQMTEPYQDARYTEALFQVAKEGIDLELALDELDMLETALDRNE